MTTLISLASCLLATTTPESTIRWEVPNPSPGAKGAVAMPGGVVLIPGHASEGRGVGLTCHATRDGGRNWAKIGLIASDPDPATDLGDGNLVRLRGGRLLATYRRNQYRGSSAASPRYAIEVAESKDGGRSWRRHSTVETSRAGSIRPSRGLWAPLLFVRASGEVQCYYDDENTPWLRGFPGHQWLMMRALDPRTGRWRPPVVVSRAPDRKHLSRDGMAAVVERLDGTLVCALESVQTEPPHAGLLRVVTSTDGGRTWDWSRGLRPPLYQPADVRYHAFSPWLLSLPSGEILCGFATNEDRPEPGISGTPPHRLGLDIKTSLSRDGGRTWGRPVPLYRGTGRNYLPGLVLLPSPDGARPNVLATFIDFDKGTLGVVGRVRSPGKD